MGHRRSWIKRLERRTEGGMVSVKQRDGTTRTFLADDFWKQLFLSEADAVVGRHNPSAASLAMAGATEEARAEIGAMIAADGGRSSRPQPPTASTTCSRPSRTYQTGRRGRCKGV